MSGPFTLQQRKERRCGEDAAVVDRLCTELGVGNDWPKRWAARAGQRLGVLKLNGQLLG